MTSSRSIRRLRTAIILAAARDAAAAGSAPNGLALWWLTRYGAHLPSGCPRRIAALAILVVSRPGLEPSLSCHSPPRR